MQAVATFKGLVAGRAEWKENRLSSSVNWKVIDAAGVEAASCRAVIEPGSRGKFAWNKETRRKMCRKGRIPRKWRASALNPIFPCLIHI